MVLTEQLSATPLVLRQRPSAPGAYMSGSVVTGSSLPAEVDAAMVVGEPAAPQEVSAKKHKKSKKVDQSSEPTVPPAVTDVPSLEKPKKKRKRKQAADGDKESAEKTPPRKKARLDPDAGSFIPRYSFSM